MLEKFGEFDVHQTLKDLKHYLPSQAPLKDFIHHNTLHAFQDESFHDGLNKASQIFGYKVYLTIPEYRNLYAQKLISEKTIDRILFKFKKEEKELWKNKLLNCQYEEEIIPRIGQLRSFWKEHYKIDLEALVHPVLFRVIGSYLDQGISIWNFPTSEKGFLHSIKELEKNSLISFFRTQRAKSFLLEDDCDLEKLLSITVGKKELFMQYLFDQQFAHPGWSGIVAVIEDNPGSLIDKKKISLLEIIQFELLLEIDALDDHFGDIWSPLGLKLEHDPMVLFSKTEPCETMEIKALWQEAYEWTYYDSVLGALQVQKVHNELKLDHSLQAVFCIDDRECSFRRYIEEEDKNCQTFSSAGHFNVEFYFQPEYSKFYTKVCPAPLTPKFLIREVENTNRRSKDFHFDKYSHGLITGWLWTHSLGFWSALRLFFTVFKPTPNSASVTSFRHMDKHSLLTIENVNGEKSEDGLQIGYTITEMTDRLEGLLKSIGLVDNFAPLIYIIGHGSSSVNNTHYAGYDCGACSGRPGSVNARVISHIGNHPKVRAELKTRGIEIPDATQFVGGLHDTSRDEIMYYDLKVLTDENFKEHKENTEKFNRALRLNAKERSRRFLLINPKSSPSKIHKKVKLRTLSLFEPRPELNHATNTLCIVGRREISKNVFLDRRSFMNSYDYSIDLKGDYLLDILNAVAPVCGGINLEYYFSRVDNQKLGAGTKLPHNVMGLIGVANGIDGDLRTGLPSQMIEVHDPLRLMVIVEHFPETVLETIERNKNTLEWFENDWVKLTVIHPETKEIFLYEKGKFTACKLLEMHIETIHNVDAVLESSHENLPVYLIQE